MSYLLAPPWQTLLFQRVGPQEERRQARRQGRAAEVHHRLLDPRQRQDLRHRRVREVLDRPHQDRGQDRPARRGNQDLHRGSRPARRHLDHPLLEALPQVPHQAILEEEHPP